MRPAHTTNSQSGITDTLDFIYTSQMSTGSTQVCQPAPLAGVTGKIGAYVNIGTTQAIMQIENNGVGSNGLGSMLTSTTQLYGSFIYYV